MLKSKKKTKIGLVNCKNILYIHNNIYSESTLLYGFTANIVVVVVKYYYIIVVINTKWCEFKQEQKEKYDGHKRGGVRYIYKIQMIFKHMYLCIFQM